jgi:hypothetical protein
MKPPQDRVQSGRGFGLLPFIIPGRFLLLVRWRPIDPMISQLLGAVLLAMALDDWLCYQAAEWEAVLVLLQVHICVSVLGAIGLLRHLVLVRTPAFAWAILVLCVAFAVGWIYFFLTGWPQEA